MPQPIQPAVRRRRRHWVAGTFWMVIAVAGVFAAFQGSPASILVTVVTLPYALYLYRGGRFVLWIW